MARPPPGSQASTSTSAPVLSSILFVTPIAPAEAIELIEGVEAEGDLVGFYHSHPAGPPEPSETDAARAAWPGASYVIVALGGEPCVGAWRWTDGDGFEAETVGMLPAER